jgi:hypothetical protein
MRQMCFWMAAWLVAIASLSGCPRGTPEGGGGGGGPTMSPEQRTRIHGDQLAFASAYARVPWVVANLGAGDWHRALQDVVYVQDQIVRLKRSATVTARPRLTVAELQPKTDELALLVQRHDPAAMPLAASLVDDFTRAAVELSSSGWIAAGWGGGAGAGAPQNAPAPAPRRESP